MTQAPFDYIVINSACIVPPMSTLGQRIRTARKRVPRLTQADIGKAAGVSAQAVNMWENEKSRPTRENLAVVARMTGVTIDWLITGTELSEPVGAVSLVDLRLSGRAIPMVSLETAVAGLPADDDAPTVSAIFPSSTDSYAISMPNDSNAPEFPRGSIMIFDPDREKEPENFVFAVFNGRPVFGRLFYENDVSGQVEIVRPMRDGWPEARSDQGTLLVRAVLAEAIIKG